MKRKSPIRIFCLVLVAIFLSGCGGGGSGSNTSPGAVVAGGGVKGPLARAVVNLYQVDLSAADLKGSLLDQGSTDAAAAIQGLLLPPGITGLVLIEVVADADTTDIASGDYPVLDTLYTVVDVQRIIDGDDVYATPLTTMVVDLARTKADSGVPYSGDGDHVITEEEFLAALTVAQSQVKSTLGFGIDATVDIFTVPPLITEQTDTMDEQTDVVEYRQAIEALTAVAIQISTDSSPTDTPQQILDALVEDLHDGEIDGLSDAEPVATLAVLDTPIDTTLATVILSDLTIPGTTIPVSDIEDELVREMEVTDATTDITDLEGGAIAVDLSMPELIVDSDSDGVDDSSDVFPNDPTETVESDDDGVGDNADVFPSDPTESVDSDNDGTGDNSDAFPDDATETTDSDDDGVGDNADRYPNDPTRTTEEFSVGGNITGLAIGQSLVLQNNGGDDLVATANGGFSFTTPLLDGDNYNVTILTQPEGQICSATNRAGTVNGANITSVTVSCSDTTYTIGGDVTGLGSGKSVVLQNNGGDDFAVNADGDFDFATPVLDGASYSITVLTQPAGQICSATNATGTVDGANITDVTVSCADSYTIGGTVTGLTGSLVFQNNGGDDLTISSDGNFSFVAPVANGAGYSVTVMTQPMGQTCALSNNSGIVSGANVTSVAASCVKPVLEATAKPTTVTLEWNATGASSYNLYSSTAPDCDIENYTGCADGTMEVNVTSPHVVSNLVNGENYWFQLESVAGGGNAISNEAGARPDQLVTNGTVCAISHDANGVSYLGGNFTQVGMRTGYGLTVNPGTGRPGAFPMVNGIVEAAVSDGDGGFYIGGEFSRVGGQVRNRLAHVLADGTLGPWNPDANSPVNAIAVSDGTVYEWRNSQLSRRHRH